MNSNGLHTVQYRNQQSSHSQESELVTKVNVCAERGLWINHLKWIRFTVCRVWKQWHVFEWLCITTMIPNGKSLQVTRDARTYMWEQAQLTSSFLSVSAFIFWKLNQMRWNETLLTSNRLQHSCRTKHLPKWQKVSQPPIAKALL